MSTKFTLFCTPLPQIVSFYSFLAGFSIAEVRGQRIENRKKKKEKRKKKKEKRKKKNIIHLNI